VSTVPEAPSSAGAPEPQDTLKSRQERRDMKRMRPKADDGSREEPPHVRALGHAISLGFRAFAGFLNVIPLEVALELGALVGSVCAYTMPKRRRTARQNLETAFPEKSPAERAKILRRSFENMGRMVVEFVRFPALDRRAIERLVEVEGREHFDRYRRENPSGGCLALSAHLGNFELISATFNAIEMIPSSLIGRKVRPEAVDAIVCGLRMSQGVATIPNKDATRDIAQRLARGEGIGVVLDQNMKRGTGVFVPFFGKPASTTPGLAVLARRSGVPVFPVFMERKGVCGRHRLRISPALAWDEGEKRRSLVANTALYTKVIEDAVRRNPEEWFWFHRRWRTQPLPGDLAGEPPAVEG
jgi:KDO2-lipid IV(A) lauroyltransferase